METNENKGLDPDISAKRARELTGLFLRKYWKPMALGTIALAFTDLMDVLPPLIIKYSIDGIESGRGIGILRTAAAIFMLAALIQAVFRFLWRKFFLGTSHTIAYDLRQRLFEHLQKLSFSYFSHSRTGELMSRLTNDVDEVRMMFGIGFLLAMDAFFYFCTVPLILFWMSPHLALYILIPLPIIPVFVVKVGSMIHSRSKRVQEKLAELSAKAQENISGIRVVKTFVREQAEIAAFQSISAGFVEENLSLARVEAWFHPCLELAMGIGIFVLIWLGGFRVLDGTISLGVFVAFQAYLLKLVWPMTALGMTINLYQRGMASLGRCSEILYEKTGISGDCHETPNMKKTGAPFCGEIEVKNLFFKYPGCSENVLKDISFRVPPGKTLAIVGPVGSGKTSLIYLLLRLYESPPGSVFLDGMEISSYPIKSLRDFLGYVPQEAFLFSESVMENVALGLKEKNDLSRIPDCLRLAQMATDIDSLPEKMETLLGERGVNLSGGQKQRLTIARALVRDPRVLIIDDSLSAVDTDTEDRILSGLKTFMKGRTTIMVSHRLASIHHADSILFLDDGKIVERGTHDELLAIAGRYSRLWEKQKLREELEKNFSPPPAIRASHEKAG